MLRTTLNERSQTRIAYSDVDVKSWAQSPPSVAAVRPAQCLSCGAAGAPMGAPLGLHGHGFRERVQLGPLAAEGAPVLTVLRLRRYRCRHCGAITVAAPRGVLPWLRYGAVAIALALSLWSAEGLSGWRTRERVSPTPSAGDEPMHGWRSLRRWSRDSGRWWRWLRASAPRSARTAALQASRTLAAKAPVPSGRVWVDACAGAALS